MSVDREEKWLILQTKINKTRIVEAFGIFRERGIEPVLIKGYAAERFYPTGRYRVSYDIDLAVAPEQFERASALLKTSELGKFNIDLHCGLRHLDTEDWPELFGRSQLIGLDGARIRVLAEEDHLRVLCVHWLTDGGENREKLKDIKYVVAGRSENFDWSRCLSVVDAKRRLWIIAVILLAEKYTGLVLEGVPEEIRNTDLPAWLPPTLEKIWRRKYPFIPLDTLLHDPAGLLWQLRHRFPPNPIMATIASDGHLDAGTRVFYQCRHILRRALPSARSFVRGVIYKFRGFLYEAK
jgi:hypothetical protein